MATIERQDPEFLVVEGGEPGAGPGGDRGPVGQPGRGIEGGDLDGSPAKFEGRRQPRGLRGSDATVLGKLADAEAKESADATMLFEQSCGQGGQRGATTTGAQDDGEEVGITQRIDSSEQGALLGAADDVRRRHGAIREGLLRHDALGVAPMTQTTVGGTADAGQGIASGYKYPCSPWPPWRQGHVMVTSAAMGRSLWLASILLVTSVACAGKPAAPANVPATGRESSGPPRPGGGWECPWPPASNLAPVDEAYVLLQVLVGPDGHAKEVTILSDPGNGFGEATRQCALRKNYAPARDASGNSVEGTTKPFRVHYSRLSQPTEHE